MAPSGGRHGSFNRGPQLPWQLQQQLDKGGGKQSGNNKPNFTMGRKPSKAKPGIRKKQRKAARQERKHHRFEAQQQQAQLRHMKQQQQAANKRPHQQVAATASNPAKRQRTEPLQSARAQHVQQATAKQQQQQQQRPAKQEQQQRAPQQEIRHGLASGSSICAKQKAGGSGSNAKSKFFDMLEADGIAQAAGAASQEAYLADLRMERAMAKQLKLRKGQQHSGPEDGLDAFLSGITAANRKMQLPPAAAAAAAAGSNVDSEGLGVVQGHDGLSSDDDMGMMFAGSESAEDGMEFMESGGSADLQDRSEDSQGTDTEDADGLYISDEDDSAGNAAESDGMDSVDGLLGSSDSDGSSAGDQPGSELESEEEHSDSGSLESVQQGGGSSSSEGGSEEEEGLQEIGNWQQSPPAAAGPKAAALAPQAAAAGAAKYVPPALQQAQKAAAAAAAVAAGNQSGAGLGSAAQRRITGLLNRLAESNLQAIVHDLLSLYETEGRRLVADAVSAGLLAAVAEGPRATEQFAAVAAVAVAGLAASARAQDIAARFLELLVARLEQAYAADDGLACHNLVMVLAYSFGAGLVAADCMYSVLAMLTSRFTESDVAMMLSLLNAVGLQLRAADPAAMKDFVLAVHQRAAAVGQSGAMSKRAEIMLEMVLDIKNNRLNNIKASRAAAAAAGSTKKGSSTGGTATGRGGAAAVLQPGLMKWLKQSGIDEVTLANISWAKLIQPDKKGMWWHPAATDAAAGLLPGLLAKHTTSSAAAAAAAAAAEQDTGIGAGGNVVGGVPGAAELLRLAAGMRFTTDARRAVFVAIMGSEDCAEASEKLLRLPLKGNQSREVIRVLIECCLQEAAYNPYYGHLAARLAAVSKAHKVTLQYCLWDQWKDIGSTEPRRLLCLAGLVAHVVGAFVLPLSAVKSVDFDAASSWTSKETFLWRHTFQQLLARFKSDEDSDAAFTRLASQQALGSLSKALGLFLRFRVGPWIVAQGDAGGLEQQTVNSCIHRLARAEKILLSSIAAVLVG